MKSAEITTLQAQLRGPAKKDAAAKIEAIVQEIKEEQQNLDNTIKLLPQLNNPDWSSSVVYIYRDASGTPTSLNIRNFFDEGEDRQKKIMRLQPRPNKRGLFGVTDVYDFGEGWVNRTKAKAVVVEGEHNLLSLRATWRRWGLRWYIPVVAVGGKNGADIGALESLLDGGDPLVVYDNDSIDLATGMPGGYELVESISERLYSWVWCLDDDKDLDDYIVARPDLKPKDLYRDIIKPAEFLPIKFATIAGRVHRDSFYNTSPMDMKTLMGDQDHIKENLYAYIQSFSPSVRDIFERFDFHTQIDRLAKCGMLYQVAEKFAGIDLHPGTVSNTEMGTVFEELIRKFAEISNETAGEHFTPREVIRLMVNLLFVEDDDVLAKPGVVRTIYDPTAGTGGMLSVAGEYLAEHNPQARLTMFGQELNDESYAICKADMLIKGQDVHNIIPGNTLSDDGHSHKVFDYMLSNPPFGVEWKKVEKTVRKEHELQGHNGRFGPGLPRVSDGSLLFLLHLISKMRPAVDGGSRFGIVLNGSPLFTGGAGSGESEIRRYVLENDLVEAIIGLPTDMFYNTGISTYIWILSNRKPAHRKGKLQLIDASSLWQKMRKSLGSKRKEMSDEHIAEVTRLFGEFIEASKDGAPISRIFRNEDFGYRTITVERPLRDADGNIVLIAKGKSKGDPQPDSDLRDTENVPLHEDVEAYFVREVLPHAPDAWIDHDKTKVGYEIPFNRHFYVFKPPRPLAEIDVELKDVTLLRDS